MKDLFCGELVRLTAEEPELRAKLEARWARDTEFHRLANTDSAQLYSDKKIKEWIEKNFEDGFKPEHYSFSIRALDNDKLIGFLGLWLKLIHSEIWVGIGIGERDYWAKGCGTDAMKLCLRYSFMELGAQRVSLGLHEYNPRALRTYEKAGFRLEGRTRKDIRREGQYYGSLWMGILREEWMLLQKGDQP